MSHSNYFFLVFTATIVAVRLILSSRRVHSPAIYGLQLHHYMYGIVFALLSIILSNLTLYAIGLGLFADELPQLLTGKITTGHIAKDWNVYYSSKMMFGVLVIIIFMYLFRNNIYNLFLVG